MDKPAQNIQDSFLNNARKEKLVVTIYLLSGVKLSGRIRSFDKYCLVLETSNQEQLIFKHAISTVVMQRAMVRDTAGERHGIHVPLHAPVVHPAPAAGSPNAPAPPSSTVPPAEG